MFEIDAKKTQQFEPISHERIHWRKKAERLIVIVAWFSAAYIVHVYSGPERIIQCTYVSSENKEQKNGWWLRYITSYFNWHLWVSWRRKARLRASTIVHLISLMVFFLGKHYLIVYSCTCITAEFKLISYFAFKFTQVTSHPSNVDFGCLSQVNVWYMAYLAISYFIHYKLRLTYVLMLIIFVYYTISAYYIFYTHFILHYVVNAKKLCSLWKKEDRESWLMPKQ